MRFVLLAALLLAACGLGPAPKPSPSVLPSASNSKADPCHAPGVTFCALNPAVTQATIKQTICVSGWTKTVRPPVSYTDQLKRQQMAAEHLTASPSAYEEDHRMALALGGAPKDPMNLSPELGASPNPKDGDEDRLHVEVCAGRMTLAAAQQVLVAKWLAAWPGYKL